jgi:hypothetical protein
MKYYYSIFNQNIEFHLPDNDELIRNFELQFSLYELKEKSDPSIIIELLDEPIIIEDGMRNPTIHNELPNGFNITSHDGCTSYEIINGILHIKAYINFEKSLLIKFIKKVINWEYTTREEKIGQIVFERLLVPSTFFFPKYFPVHCAGFLSPNQKVVLIGGTGGVGKTSAEIEFCLNRGYKFLCDDIAILNANEELYPNYSFPKIYGYNIVDNYKMKKIVFHNRSLLDKISWVIQKWVLGTAKVRRKINPEVVYSIPKGNNFPVDSFFILTREFRDDFNISRISAETATKLNLNIIQTEYYQFFNHIYWHMFNRNADSIRSLIDNDSLSIDMTISSLNALKNVKCYLIKAPIKIKHQAFIQELCDLVEETL